MINVGAVVIQIHVTIKEVGELLLVMLVHFVKDVIILMDGEQNQLIKMQKS